MHGAVYFFSYKILDGNKKKRQQYLYLRNFNEMWQQFYADNNANRKIIESTHHFNTQNLRVTHANYKKKSDSIK